MPESRDPHGRGHAVLDRVRSGFREARPIGCRRRAVGRPECAGERGLAAVPGAGGDPLDRQVVVTDQLHCRTVEPHAADRVRDRLALDGVIDAVEVVRGETGHLREPVEIDLGVEVLREIAEDPVEALAVVGERGRPGGRRGRCSRRRHTGHPSPARLILFAESSLSGGVLRRTPPTPPPLRRSESGCAARPSRGLRYAAPSDSQLWSRPLR